MRPLPAALLVAAAPLAAPLAAQSAPAPSPRPTDAGGQMAADPDQVTSGGVQVPGWAVRFDRAGARADQVSFRRAGGGYRVTAGPSGVYYAPRTTAGGNYTVAATLTQTKAPTHPEAYGLFAGGQNLDGAAPSYMYFVVRGDGKYLVRHRANATEVHTLVDWTASPALRAAGADGRATNALEIRVAADSVRFVANGTRVAAVSRREAGAMAGVAGIRVNHNLDVQVDGFAVRRSAAATRTAAPAGRRATR